MDAIKTFLSFLQSLNVNVGCVEKVDDIYLDNVLMWQCNILLLSTYTFHKEEDITENKCALFTVVERFHNHTSRFDLCILNHLKCKYLMLFVKPIQNIRISSLETRRYEYFKSSTEIWENNIKEHQNFSVMSKLMSLYENLKWEMSLLR